MTVMQRVVIIGAGGFAREVEWLLREINRGANEELFRFIGYVVSDLQKLGPHDSREQVLGDEEWLVSNGHAYDALALGIGTPVARDRVGTRLAERFPEKHWPVLRHPSVQLDEASCSIAPGVVLCAGVIATVNVTLEHFSMANLSCTLGHETRIGRGTVLNPTVNISGGVTLGARVLVGTGAQVLQYLSIGDNSIVGAGAVVTKPVAANTTVTGIPARIMAPR